MRQQLIDSIYLHKLIAIFRGTPEDKILPIMQALYDGGIRIAEITLDQKHPETHIDTFRVIEKLRTKFNGYAFIGAGTVLTSKQALLAHNAGAQLIVSPNFNSEVISTTRELGCVSIPGAFTATEIVQAYESGADFVKVFPAGDITPGYIRSLSAPIGHIPLLAVGSINKQNIQTYLNAGVVGVGLGVRNMLPADVDKFPDYQKVIQLTTELYSAIGL